MQTNFHCIDFSLHEHLTEVRKNPIKLKYFVLVEESLILQVGTITLLINWSTSELNRQLNPTTCLGDTDCWIQQVTAPTL